MQADPHYDLAIIGGGPAGQAAAERVIAAGLSVCMLDEQQQPGGQILRQPAPTIQVQGWMQDRLYRKLKEQLHRTSTLSGLRWMGGTSVIGLWREEEGFRLSVSGAEVGHVRATRVLIATGCYDMPVALPGWTLPGVMSAGGLQTLLKGQQIISGQAIILFGTHPLMLVLAEQLLKAGVKVKAILFAQPLARFLRISARHALAGLAHPGPLAAAFTSWNVLRKAGVPLYFGARVTELVGHEGTLTGVTMERGKTQSHLSCDSAAMCFGFLPQSDLPRSAGAEVRWSQPAGGWETIHDAGMRSSIDGLYIAGETSGVAGADAALLEGAIAGVSIATDAGRMPIDAARPLARALRHKRARLQGFIDLLRAVADPRDYMPKAEDETIICRCEDVSAKEVDTTIATFIADNASSSANIGASAVKLRCRAGMGLCQGRSCEHAIIRRLAAATGRCPEEISGFRPRYPIRPTPIADLLDPS